ncbi:MAG: phospho-sugar mutase [Bacteroidales bacterium]|nr:phospho-sugar mutase [Bacteroidales bacterium]
MKTNKIIHMNQDVLTKAQAWLSNEFDQETRERVQYLIENDEKELTESFYRDLEFGTGGLRGIMGVGTNRMNIYTLGMATQGLANYLKKEFAGLDQIKVVIAHDSRNNSRLFAETTAKIFSSNNIKAYLFEDLRPTPELSFAIRHFKAQSGVMITASHNPKEYNGYKAYWDDGGQIIEPHDTNIINEVQAIRSINEIRFKGDNSLIEIIGQEIDEIYTDLVKELSVKPDMIKRNADLKIVYTPIHGTGVKLVPLALRKFGFKNIFNVPEQDIPDGNFPTVYSPNPEEPAALKMAIEKAEEIDADLVMATDPDADRVGIAVKDRQGKISLLNGNQTASLLINYLISAWSDTGKLKGQEYICKTIVTTDLLNKIADEYGVKHFDVLTGFKFIADIIKKNEGEMKFIGGGEESYGYLAGEFVRDKDAVMSCALIAEVTAWAQDQGKSLFDILIDIYLKYGFYLESLISVVRKGKEGAEEIQKMMAGYRSNPPKTINGSRVLLIHDYQEGRTRDLLNQTHLPIELPKSNVLQFLLEDGTKISVRPSGTEPKIKFYFSVNEKLEKKEDYEKVKKLLEERVVAIQKELGLV